MAKKKRKKHRRNPSLSLGSAVGTVKKSFDLGQIKNGFSVVGGMILSKWIAEKIISNLSMLSGDGIVARIGRVGVAGLAAGGVGMVGKRFLPRYGQYVWVGGLASATMTALNEVMPQSIRDQLKKYGLSDIADEEGLSWGLNDYVDPRQIATAYHLNDYVDPRQIATAYQLDGMADTVVAEEIEAQM